MNQSTHGLSTDGMGVDWPELLTVPEVATLLRLNIVTVYQRVREDPDRWGRVNLGGKEVRLRASKIREILFGDRAE